MDNRVHVGNLGEFAEAGSLRSRFASCGEVTHVEMRTERSGLRSPVTAFVTMITRFAAERAVRELNGAILNGRAMVVSLASSSGVADSPPEGRGAARRAEAARERTILAITQQYRERTNMTYELGCTGQTFVLRVFFPVGDSPDSWRIDARPSDAGEAIVVTATTKSRETSLTSVAEAWDAHVAAGRAVFDIKQNMFEADDVGCLGEPLGAQAGGQQGLRQRALGLGHFFEGKSFARFGDKVPVKPLFIPEWKEGLSALFGVERGQKLFGGIGHFDAGRGGSRRQRNDHPYQRNHALHRF